VHAAVPSLIALGFNCKSFTSLILEFSNDSSLRGPGVEIVVGRGLRPASVDYTAQTWTLPQALVSHYSAVLCNVCDRIPPATHGYRIVLPNVDPIIFDLFVEWVHHGGYTLDSDAMSMQDPNVSFATQAWALGDVLKATGFKNYTMDRLYHLYVTDDPSEPVTPTDVRFVCTNSATDSKLRLLFFDIVTTHFSNAERVLGNVDEWDAVMQEHPDLRMYNHQGRRSSNSQVGSRRRYMEAEEAEESREVAEAGRAEASRAVLLERDADGVTVKQEPVDEEVTRRPRLSPRNWRDERFSLSRPPPWRSS
jgi:hypothetical protein